MSLIFFALKSINKFLNETYVFDYFLMPTKFNSFTSSSSGISNELRLIFSSQNHNRHKIKIPISYLKFHENSQLFTVSKLPH